MLWVLLPLRARCTTLCDKVCQLLTGQKFGFAGEGMTPPGCPPGLEYLAQLDELQLNQKVDVLESMYLLIG
jgi:hypothetical protein